MLKRNLLRLATTPNHLFLGGRLKPMCWALWWFDAEAQFIAVGHHSKPPVFGGEAETHVLGPLVV